MTICKRGKIYADEERRRLEGNPMSEDEKRRRLKSDIYKLAELKPRLFDDFISKKIDLLKTIKEESLFIH